MAAIQCQAGQGFVITISLFNSSGSPADPSGDYDIIATLIPPGSYMANPSTQDLLGGGVVKQSVGVYTVNVQTGLPTDGTSAWGFWVLQTYCNDPALQCVGSVVYEVVGALITNDAIPI